MTFLCKHMRALTRTIDLIDPTIIPLPSVEPTELAQLMLVLKWVILVFGERKENK
jgi:hypothetical protein